MKLCLACDTPFDSGGWRCPRCGFAPELRDGFPAFAPELALESDGFHGSYFSGLAEREAGNFWFRARNRLIVWALGHYFPQAASLFEIGCGTGFVLAGIRAARPEMELAGSDVFTEGLAFAHRRTGAPLYQVDARAIPFRHAFDVVGAFDVLEHIEEDEEALRQIRLALRPGGGMLITVPQHRFLWSVVDEFSRHKRRYTRAELVAKVERAGFEVLRVTSFVSLLLPLMLASRLRQRATVETFDPAAEYAIGPALNGILEAALVAELEIIKRGASLPVGGSLLVAARLSKGRP